MKSVCLLICLIVMLLESGVTSASSEDSYKNSAYPGKCVLNSTTILNQGQSITGQGCTQISCRVDGLVVVLNCAPGRKLCAKLKYPDAEFPKCCIREPRCLLNDNK